MFNLSLAWDRPSRTGAHPTRHVLRVRLQPDLRAAIGDGLPVRMAIALDLSGSMVGEKLVYAKEACRRIIDMLRPSDRFWLTGFSTDLVPIIDDLHGGGDHAGDAVAALRGIAAAGATRTELGLEWILKTLREPGNDTRIGIMITDGHATDVRGKTLESSAPLLSIADRIARAGIGLSTVGLGNAAHFNAPFLVDMSDHGRGSFIYADSPATLSEALLKSLAKSQAMSTSSGALNVGIVAAGTAIQNACRMRPDYVPLECVAEAGGFHVELGALRSDTDTDILLDFAVPAPTSVSAEKMTVGVVRLEAPGAKEAVASLSNTSSYTQAQAKNDDVDKDKLAWEVNMFTADLGRSIDPRKTASLLDSIQRTAVKAGASDIAAEAKAQMDDLKATGKLTPHRTTGLLTQVRGFGESQ